MTWPSGPFDPGLAGNSSVVCHRRRRVPESWHRTQMGYGRREGHDGKPGERSAADCPSDCNIVQGRFRMEQRAAALSRLQLKVLAEGVASSEHLWRHLVRHE